MLHEMGRGAHARVCRAVLCAALLLHAAFSARSPCPLGRFLNDAVPAASLKRRSAHDLVVHVKPDRCTACPAGKYGWLAPGADGPMPSGLCTSCPYGLTSKPGSKFDSDCVKSDSCQ